MDPAHPIASTPIPSPAYPCPPGLVGVDGPWFWVAATMSPAGVGFGVLSSVELKRLRERGRSLGFLPFAALRDPRDGDPYLLGAGKMIDEQTTWAREILEVLGTGGTLRVLTMMRENGYSRVRYPWLRHLQDAAAKGCSWARKAVAQRKGARSASQRQREAERAAIRRANGTRKRAKAMRGAARDRIAEDIAVLAKADRVIAAIVAVSDRGASDDLIVVSRANLLAILYDEYGDGPSARAELVLRLSEAERLLAEVRAALGGDDHGPESSSD